jgi:integrase
MGRRAPGEGSIYPVRKNKKIVGYAASVSLGYSTDGKRRRKKVEGKTRREVAEQLAKFREQLGDGVDLTKRTEATRHILDRWITDVYAATASPSSVQKYRWAFDKANPFIGEIPVQKLTSMRAQELITDLTGIGLAAASVGQIIACLRYAFDHIRKPWRLITHNPFEDVVKPRPETKKAIFLSPAQAQALLAAAQSHRLYAAIRIMLSLGLRRGEVCALRWDDIDFENRRLTVKATLNFIKTIGRIEGKPKSESSRRILPIPAALLAALRWHKAAQDRERELLGYGKSDYVFTAAESDNSLNPNNLYAAVKLIIRETDLPQDLTPHDLRHSCASFLIAQNVHAKVISAILGHASIRITLDLYGHLFPAQLDDAANAVEGIFEEAPANTKGRLKSG